MKKTRIALTRRVLLGAAVVAGVDAVATASYLASPDSSSARRIAVQRWGRPSHARSQAQVLFGAWQPGGDAGVRRLEAQLGRRLAIVHWYQGWGVPAPANQLDVDRAKAVVASGATPMITWEPWNYQDGIHQPEFALRRILAGDYDDYIARNARAMASVPGLVWLRFAHDMNVRVFPWSVGNNGSTAAEYVGAWKRVVRIVREEGATNVRFVWCPNVLTPHSTPLETLWPGDDDVDYLGMDGFNWGRTGNPPGWPSLPSIFGGLYGELRKLSDKPVVIAEVGCADAGGDKAQWIRDAFGHDLRRHFPGVAAVVWYNEAGQADWRLTASTSTLRAARDVFDRAPYIAIGT